MGNPVKSKTRKKLEDIMVIRKEFKEASISRKRLRSMGKGGKRKDSSRRA